MARLKSFVENLTGGLWFIPLVMTVGGVALFGLSYSLDLWLGGEASGLPAFLGSPGSARSLLSNVAGNLVTVMATLFSITIVTLQLASSQYSPRLLRNFMSDRTIQVVLGAFVADFVYSILVVRIIRVSDSGNVFYPVVSVHLAYLTGLATLALLIYFIHHVASAIQSSSVIKGSHDETIKVLERLEDLTDEPEHFPDESNLPPDLPAKTIRSGKSGYLVYLDIGDLVKDLARTEAEVVVVETALSPGDFVTAGLPLVRVRGEVGARGERTLREVFVLGEERTFQQDFMFGIRQLVDVALKGISPAINNPTMTVQVLERLGAICVALGSKALPRRVREYEADGSRVLVKVAHPDFDEVAGLAFDQILRTSLSEGYVVVLEALLDILAQAMEANELPERRRALWRRAFSTARQAPGQIPDPADAAALVLRTVKLGGTLLGTELGPEVDEDLSEITSLSEGLRDGEQVRRAAEAARKGLSPRASGA